MRNVRNRDGFTLIELMIVVVIIGILAAIAIPRFSAVSKNAKQAEAGSINKQICTLALTYKDQKGSTEYGTADLDDLKTVGWDPATADAAQYFTFSFSSGVATAATKDAAQTKTEKMDCATGAITSS